MKIANKTRMLVENVKAWSVRMQGDNNMRSTVLITNSFAEALHEIDMERVQALDFLGEFDVGQVLDVEYDLSEEEDEDV
jgi:hypothetical protein